MKLEHRIANLFRSAAISLALIWNAASAMDITVIAPNAVKLPLLEIAARHEAATGHRMVFSWGGTEAITQRIREGEPFDVVVSSAQSIDSLMQDGLIAPASRTPFAKSAIGVASRAGMAKPDISSVDGVKESLLRAKSIAVSSGTSGRHLLELFARLGVAEQIRSKLRQPPSGAQIGEMVASGEVELGFQQVSELVHVKGIEYLGPLPAEIQFITVYSAGVGGKSGLQEAGAAFLRRLVQTESESVFNRAGLEPCQ